MAWISENTVPYVFHRTTIDYKKGIDSSSARRSCLVSSGIDNSYKSILGECARDGRLAHHVVLPRFFAVEEWPSRRDFTVIAGLLHRVHRVATATFWRTFQHDGKLTQAGEGGGCTPTPFHYIYHHVQRVVVYAPAMRADTLPYFSSTPICTLWFAPLIP
jgi:hypothetical protein